MEVFFFFFLGFFQVPLSLLCINPQDLLAFEDALTKTASLNEEKQCMRSLLILGTRNKLNLFFYLLLLYICTPFLFFLSKQHRFDSLLWNRVIRDFGFLIFFT